MEEDEEYLDNTDENSLRNDVYEAHYLVREPSVRQFVFSDEDLLSFKNDFKH